MSNIEMGVLEEAQPSDEACPQCGSANVCQRRWRSDTGYCRADFRYDCLDCLHFWWSDA